MNWLQTLRPTEIITLSGLIAVVMVSIVCWFGMALATLLARAFGRAR